jgi:hypothetical protein
LGLSENTKDDDDDKKDEDVVTLGDIYRFVKNKNKEDNEDGELTMVFHMVLQLGM